MSIKNVEELRNLLLSAINDLSQDASELDRVSIVAKSAEAVMSSLKLQLQYAGMRNEEPNIKFLNTSEKQKRLPAKRDSNS